MQEYDEPRASSRGSRQQHHRADEERGGRNGAKPAQPTIDAWVKEMDEPASTAPDCSTEARALIAKYLDMATKTRPRGTTAGAGSDSRIDPDTRSGGGVAHAEIMEWLARVMAIAGGLVLTALVILVCVSVSGAGSTRSAHSTFLTGAARLADMAGRHGRRPVKGDFEVVEAGIAFAIFAFLPICQLYGAHATVDVFTNLMPKRVNRFSGLLGSRSGHRARPDRLAALSSAALQDSITARRPSCCSSRSGGPMPPVSRLGRGGSRRRLLRRRPRARSAGRGAPICPAPKEANH
jgi:hypothetical protein